VPETGVAAAVLNAANEVAVAQFLDGAIAFPAIPASIEHAMNKLVDLTADTLESLLDADQRARVLTEHYLAGI
jgi:1-deoxy-D-xylulose-5-phosphate reductoisomerase